MVDTAMSKNWIPIRLTDERWEHIISEHAELIESRQDLLITIADPDLILAGSNKELLAVRQIDIGKWMVVVYRELKDDGFIITAFWTRRYQMFSKRKELWSR